MRGYHATFDHFLALLLHVRYYDVLKLCTPSSSLRWTSGSGWCAGYMPIIRNLVGGRQAERFLLPMLIPVWSQFNKINSGERFSISLLLQ